MSSRSCFASVGQIPPAGVVRAGEAGTRILAVANNWAPEARNGNSLRKGGE